MSQVIGELSKPSAQFPQIVFFMGHQLKNRALRQLCGNNYRNQNRHHRTINLWLDNQSFLSDHPWIFADADLSCRSISPPFVSPRICHQQENLPVQWPKSRHEPHDLIIARLLFLFTDVVCVFADDLGGLKGVQEYLSTWIQIGSASSLPAAVWPRVIVVLGNQPKSITQSVLEEDDFLFEILHLSGLPFFSTFSGIQISRLPAEELSTDARYLQLGSDLFAQLRHMRQVCEEHHVLFSAQIQMFYLKKPCSMQQLDCLHHIILSLPRDGGIHLMECSHLIWLISSVSAVNHGPLMMTWLHILPQPS